MPSIHVEDFLDPANVHVGLRASDKRRLLSDLADQAGQALSVSSKLIREALLAREALGSTGMGEGIAIPHARLAEIDRPFGLLATLKTPTEFGSVDDRPVDLIFLLLLPIGSTGAHLGALASVSRKLRDERIAAALRRSKGALEAFALFADRPAGA
ncbi:PTS sugar transporter subunit IIA [uncultured Enterovirga sp.]|uniref:PTS sugar transporter subunit IIA n=1 Tax=uncultured Enterovirga sp. TaxID=2026352 RepID=UPI0035CA591D